MSSRRPNRWVSKLYREDDCKRWNCTCSQAANLTDVARFEETMGLKHYSLSQSATQVEWSIQLETISFRDKGRPQPLPLQGCTMVESQSQRNSVLRRCNTKITEISLPKTYMLVRAKLCFRDRTLCTFEQQV